MSKKIITFLLLVILLNICATAQLTVGGYGEAAYSYNFYSDAWNRYKSPANFRGDTHQRVDIPHVV
ncbi:MAG: hypothetical protein K2F78_03420, partial [Muribaculaceae bacterium]|nr:hypothetical protein [Muribaculaceae bacterium]